MDPPIDTCPVCKKHTVEPGFLYCKACWEAGVVLCFRCRRAPTRTTKESFCDPCWLRRMSSCDRCKSSPSEKGELLCGKCWQVVSMCPLCKIEKLPKRWNICKKCFHAGNRLCLRCRDAAVFPGKMTCAPCEVILNSKPVIAPAVAVAPATPLRELSLDKFLERWATFITNPRTKIVFFIGAGCSISSGIPAASRLVLDWKFPAGTPYIDAITQRFPLRSERGEEFWRLCHDKQPAQGYLNFATLVRRLQPRLNLILTTNFDHMLRRALPEVLDASDPYSAQFAPWWLDHNSPVLFQLHGDYTKIVANTQDEMHRAIEDPVMRERDAVPIEVSSILRPMLHRRPQVLIVVGYSGNDANIRELFQKSDLEVDSVYWINGTKPTPANCAMYDTLLSKQMIWVNHLSWDTLTDALLASTDRVFARPAAAPPVKPAAPVM